MADEPADKPSPTQKTKANELLETMALENSGKDTGTDTEFNVTPAPGIVFGRYKIEDTLGEGAMGSVFLAHDTQLDRKIALKIPKFGSAVNDKQLKRFYREARAAAMLTHPNICPVYDVGELEGTHYIAMAHLKGRPLSDYIKPDRPADAKSAALIVRKLALALHEAHTSGVVHRDIKPANIMIDQRKEPVMMDFGLACQEETGDDSRITQNGAILGSPAYMSKEQLEGNIETIGPQSDIYSLGVVFYELLTGDLPFKGSGSVVSMIGEILTKESPDPVKVRKDIDPRMAAVCKKALAKLPEDRYKTMAEFATAIGAASKPIEKAKTAAKPAKNDLKLAKLSEQAKMAKTLCDEGQHAAAATILTKLTTSSDASSEHQAWAKGELEKVQAVIAKQEAIAMVETEVNTGWLDDDVFDSVPQPNAALGNTIPGTSSGNYGAFSPQPKPRRNLKKIGIIVGGTLLTLTGLAVGTSTLLNTPATPKQVAQPEPSKVPVAEPKPQGPTIEEAQASIKDAINEGIKQDRTPMGALANQQRSESDSRPDKQPPPETPPGPPLDAPTGRGQDRRPSPADVFTRFDTNSDQRISETELPRAMRPLHAESDIDKDGYVSMREFEKASLLLEEIRKRRPPGFGPGGGPGPRGSRP